MFNFDRFARVTTASVGALVLATLSITAAVGPVSAADVGRVATASVHDQAQARG